MSDFNASDRDVTRAIRSWLHEDRHEDFSRVAGAVLDLLDTTPAALRRRCWTGWRRPHGAVSAGGRRGGHQP